MPALAGEPIVTLANGDRAHIRHTDLVDAPVLFMNFGESNYLDVIDQAKRGGFKIVLATLFEPGDWHTPFRFDKRGRPEITPFQSFDALAAAIDRFRAENIVVAVHGFWNVLHQDGTGQIVDFADPSADWSQIVYTVPVGSLMSNIDERTRAISLQSEIKRNPRWQHLAVENTGVRTWGKPWHYSTYAIDGELIRVTDDKIDELNLEAFRGVERTKASSHQANALVSYVPNRSGYFLLAGSEYQRKSIDLFQHSMMRLGISFFYCDGWSYVNEIGENFGESTESMYGKAIAPYFENVDGVIQFGGRVPEAAKSRVLWVASGDALWAKNAATGRFDMELLLGIKRDLIGREIETAPYRFEAGWLPLSEDLTADDIAAIYGDPTLKGRRRTWQEMPGWTNKPKPERDALLALIRNHERELAERN